jgi:hypothetical protein
LQFYDLKNTDSSLFTSAGAPAAQEQLNGIKQQQFLISKRTLIADHPPPLPRARYLISASHFFFQASPHSTNSHYISNSHA